MKHIIFLAVLFIALPQPLGLCQEKNGNLHKQLQNLVKETNTTLPKMISKEIQMVKLVVKENNEVAIISKTLFYDASDLNINALESALKPGTKNNICSKPDSVLLMKRGVSFTYVYYDKSNKYIGKFTITSKDCGF